MNKIKKMLLKMEVKACCALEEFKNSERGDTNFISILIILGIVVVIAGLFTVLSGDVMERISEAISNFLDSLGF